MRTIKFRGKASHIDMWLYGDLIKVNSSYHILGEDDMTEDGHHVKQDSDRPTWVDEETIGQFTGLFDKNDKEIYEGDIIKYTRYKVHSEYLKEDVIEDVYVVYWNEEKHAFYCFTKFDCGGATGLLVFHDERAEKEEIEVIGNIHDNPELLKD